MPNPPFSPVHVSFISGVRQDIGKIAQESPSQLRQAQNVVFMKRGHLVGRPGLVSREASVQTTAGAALVGSLATAIGGSAVPSGIVSTGFPALNKSDVDTPMACWQGQSYFNRNGIWEFAGTHWSLRQTKSTVLDIHDPSGNLLPSRGVPVGKDVVGALTSIGSTSGVPFLTKNGDIEYLATGVLGSTTSLAGADKVVAAGNALFWATFTGGGNDTVFGVFPAGGVLGAGPQTSAEISLTTVPTAAAPGLAACTDGTFFYLAVGGTSPGPGTTNVLKVNSSGTVLQTLSVTWAAGSMATARAQDICYDPTSNRLGLVAINNSTGVVATKVLTLVGGVMADAGIDLTLGTANLFNFDQAAQCGVTHNGQMSVVFGISATNWTTGALIANMNGSVVITGRSFTAATTGANTTLSGAVNANSFGQTWYPLFAGQVVAGRTLVGVFHGYENTNQSSQWVVLDMTTLYASGNTSDRTVVACGPVYASERWQPTSAYSDGTRVQFAIGEGLTFTSGQIGFTPNINVPNIARAGVRRITLEPQGVQAAHVHGATLLSGQLMHVFDGNKIRPDHFPEETPYIFNANTGGSGVAYGSAGGSLLGGSYSYQATWEALNASGQVIRSGASPILVANGVTAGQKVVLQVAKPQLWNNYSISEFVRVRLWATQANPTNNAPKYLVTETITSAPQTGFSVTMTHSTDAVGNEEQLYETVDTLADMRAPGADRGIVVVNERAWVADQEKLYVSKLIHPNIATAWNTEDTNVLTLPSSLGTIQSLSSIQQTLVVLCSRGVAIVVGAGVDDTGAGQGWTLQILEGAPGMGSASPRSATTTPAGVVYQTQDGDVWMVSSSGQAVPLSRPMRDYATQSFTTPPDVVLVTPTPKSNTSLMVHGPNGLVRVLDMETGQWGTWTFAGMNPANGQFFASINGALWVQFLGPFVIGSADSWETTASGDFIGTGVDAQGPVTAVIETGVLRQGNPTARGWGRLRSVVINELRTINDDLNVTYTMSVFADQNDRPLMTSKSLTVSPNNPVTFPGGSDGGLEFRTSVQKCAYARVLMSIAPAVFNLEGLDLWVANAGDKAPTNNRS